MIALGVHSHYSLLRGTASPGALCRAASRLGYRALALTDTDNLYGLWAFLAACRREGIEPVVGAELTDPRRGDGLALCLAATAEGYRSLCRLLSRRRFAEAEGFDAAAAIARFASGLLVLAENAELLERLHACGVPAAAAVTPQAILRSHPLRQAARRLHAPEFAVHPAFFLSPDDHRLHRLLRAIDRRTLLARLAAEEAAPASARLLSPAELARAFASDPDLLAASEALGASVSFRGPRFGSVLPPRPGETAAESLAALRRAAYEGAHRRYGAELPEAVVERLEHELDLIGRRGYGAYFLIVRDIVALSPRTCGRGSAAASLVAYCLGITNVCPLKHNLYFERFLHPGRTDPPDIDVDFAWDERDAVIAAVIARHRGRAARIANHVLFRPRLALRETARAWGIGEAEILRLSRRLPDFWLEDGEEAALEAEEPETTRLPDPWPEVLELARRLVGIPRHLSLHPGGVVITPGPITDYAPIEPSAAGGPLLPWDKDGVEEAGLVKIDLLGNRSLAVIRDTLASLGEKAPFRDFFAGSPEEDFATQQTVAQGRTLGCFYIESPAMRLLLRKGRVGDFDHLVILSSIIRPAAGAYIREFLRRLHGGPWEPLHPLLADILAETFGLLVYQEDVARTAVALAGFSPAEADGLRKVLSKKDRDRALADFARRFREGARARGLSEAQIAAVWDMILSFEGYSFCKPHSASYARVSFQAAYLKTHHPAEFMAAVLANEGGFYRPLAYVSEARRLGLRVLPPDVAASAVRWSGGGRTLRVGLSAVRDLSAELPVRIVACRAERPFADLEDFLARTRPTAEEFRALLDAGALDGLGGGEDRAVLAFRAARLRCARGGSRPQQESLFAPPAADGPPPRFPPEEPHERLHREFAVLGFLCDRHPIELYAPAVEKAGGLRAVELSSRIGRRVRFAGWPITGKLVATRSGEPMAFLTFEDETGLLEATLFPRPYRRFRRLLATDRPLLLAGRVEEDGGALTLTVDSLEPLPSPLPGARRGSRTPRA